QFDEQGSQIFQELTKNNINKPLAIYLDGAPISTPVVREEISGGKAQISGKFTLDEAKQLSMRLNQGALPVPITLLSQESIGSSLGIESTQKSVKAVFIGLILVALFMILYYRGAGLVASLALLIYAIFSLAIFKTIPVTLTLSGIAGFAISIGMAVDANVLIFERTKEEIRKGKNNFSAIGEGFARAWPAIRDSNICTLISVTILYFLTSSMIRGFALTLGIGVLLSMFSAIFISRLLLLNFVSNKSAGHWWFNVSKKREILTTEKI
ncbi:MAG: protein translocase subunit SecD, partial [Candidatus Parcubacteria bacterium]|nr:protein translocase subunit SecD [Candidatus Parcubacteria bacterium]